MQLSLLLSSADFIGHHAQFSSVPYVRDTHARRKLVVWKDMHRLWGFSLVVFFKSWFDF